MASITVDEMRQALDSFGIERDAIVLTHSSLKALGQIEGGAEAVIKAVEGTVPDGTVVFPTLSQKNFETAFEDWSLERPSDVGLISETFRLQAGTVRSDNPTHSVAARGKHAADLISGHAGGKGRYGVFGDLCFGLESPWQRMFDSRTRYGVRCYVLFWGVSTDSNTFKHFSEYRLAERLLENVKDPQKHRELILGLEHKPPVMPPDGVEQVWLYYSQKLLEPMLFARGLVRSVALGNGSLLLCDVYEMMTFTEAVLTDEPERIIRSKAALSWIARAKSCAGDSAQL